METKQASGSGLTDFCDADRHYGQKKHFKAHIIVFQASQDG